VLYGAVVGGPIGIITGMDIEGEDKTRYDNTYTDLRHDYISNEVGARWWVAVGGRGWPGGCILKGWVVWGAWSSRLEVEVE